MSWVEELKPDDEVEVEIIYPKAYVDHNIFTMRRYAKRITKRKYLSIKKPSTFGHLS